MSTILGISAFYHDSAAALVVDGRLVAAAQEERFSRKRHDADFPLLAVRYCLAEAGLTVADLDAVAFYDKPLLKFERLLVTYLGTFPKGLPSFLKAMPVWLKDKLWIGQTIRGELDEYEGPIHFTTHHQSHAASSFLVSPFDEAAILTVDGVGEWATTTTGVGRGNRIVLDREIRFPHSLGLLYSAVTYYLGFKVNSAEYKVMGLAPYGQPIYADQMLRDLVHVAADGSFALNMDYFSFDGGLTMTNDRFAALFGRPVRDPKAELTQFDKDMAASVQRVTEEILLRLARDLHRRTGLTALCMAGGVALNCVANARILNETPFTELFIQPAAGDAGGAVGAAFSVACETMDEPRRFRWPHANWGPAYSDDEIEAVLRGYGAPFERLDEAELLCRTAAKIADQQVVGWFQGRMEFGPRALGARSILADPRNAKNQSVVNLKIKFRESFRPFAPAVLAERAADYFSLNTPSPYMLLTAQTRGDGLPAVTHVDGSARVQTVHADQTPLFHRLIAEFDRQTGCPVVINTSFNVRGEPIVCTPDDAFLCFMESQMDALAMGSFLLDKADMAPLYAARSWQRTFQPD